jgi:hypothetical protein
MAPKKGNPVELRLRWYRESLDDIRRSLPFLRLTPALFDGEDETRTLIGHPSLNRAAEFFGLDLSVEAQRALLLQILADVIFAESKKGRPPAKKAKWDRLTLIQLAVDCNKVKTETPGISDKKAASIIKRDFSSRYKHASAEMIRQYLADARSCLENENRIRADRGMAPLKSELTCPIFSIDRSYLSDL